MFAQDKEATSFLKDEIVKSKFAKAKKLSEVQVKDYDAIFYVGGHGPVLDLASDPINARLASEVNRSSPSKTIRHIQLHSSGKLARSYRPSAMDQRKIISLHNNELTF